MELQILRLFGGYVRIRIIGNSYDRFLNLCANRGIVLWNLQPAGEAYEANISRKDFKKLKAVVKKSHTFVKITGKHGLPFFIHKYRKRKFWVGGIAAAILFMYWLSAHIWMISIDGNLSQTDDVMFEYLDQNGIYHGMKKANVDCRALAADIRNYFTDFTWVAVELKGTRLNIYVKEGIIQTDTSRTDVKQDEDLKSGGKQENELVQADAPAIQEAFGSGAGISAAADSESETVPFNLVASEAGTVVSIYVRKGLPMVEIGDTVEAGTLLVTGSLPVYDDSGEVKTYQYVSPDADIIIRTSMEYRDEVPLLVQKKEYTGEEKRSVLFHIGSFPLGIGKISYSYEYAELFSSSRQAKLFENFYLPLSMERFWVKEYVWREEKRSKEEAEAIANLNFQNFIQNLEEKGVQIFENDVKIEWCEKFCTVSGTLTVGSQAVRREGLQEVQETEEELQVDEYG